MRTAEQTSILDKLDGAIREEFERSVRHFDEENPLLTDRQLLRELGVWFHKLMHDPDGYQDGETYRGFHRALTLIRIEQAAMEREVKRIREGGR